MGREQVETLWREPTQERSRKKVAVILDAAAQLIEEHGADQLKTSAVAERAGVPIGTVYQFFPDRQALLARLYSEKLEALREIIVERFAQANSPESLLSVSTGLIEDYHNAFTREPVLVELTAGVLASPVIRYLEAEDSRRNGDLLYEVARPLAAKRVSAARLRRACFLVCHLTGPTSMLAVTLSGAEGKQLIREYAAMARGHLAAILGLDPD